VLTDNIGVYENKIIEIDVKDISKTKDKLTKNDLDILRLFSIVSIEWLKNNHYYNSIINAREKKQKEETNNRCLEVFKDLISIIEKYPYFFRKNVGEHINGFNDINVLKKTFNEFKCELEKLVKDKYESLPNEIS
jgi:hypothetical protein